MRFTVMYVVMYGVAVAMGIWVSADTKSAGDAQSLGAAGMLILVGGVGLIMTLRYEFVRRREARRKI